MSLIEDIFEYPLNVNVSEQANMTTNGVQNEGNTYDIFQNTKIGMCQYSSWRELVLIYLECYIKTMSNTQVDYESIYNAVYNDNVLNRFQILFNYEYT